MRKVRDLTAAQFRAACAKQGWTFTGFLGYVDVGHGCHVSHLNAGDNRRAKLAYLQRQADKAADRSADA